MKIALCYYHQPPYPIIRSKVEEIRNAPTAIVGLFNTDSGLNGGHYNDEGVDPGVQINERYHHNALEMWTSR